MKGIVCPNHRVELILTNDKGVGICPISHCRFTYEADSQEKNKKLRVTASGALERITSYKVTGND